METVRLRFRYAEEDYVRAMRAHYAARLRVPLDVAALLVVAAIGLYEIRSGSHEFGIVLLSLSGILALMLVAAFVVIPRVAFRREPKFRDDYTLTFSPEGIHFQTIHIDSDLRWSMYTRVLVDAHSFLLYYGSQQFTVIPKRVFEDDAQRETFERLLAHNIANVVDKRR